MREESRAAATPGPLAQAGGAVIDPETSLPRNKELVDTPPANVQVRPEAAEPPPGARWALAPIRWGGTLGETLSQNRSSGTRSTSLATTLDLRAQTYIYAPWFAQVSGGIGVFRSSDNAKAGDTETKSTSTGLTGNAALALFPVSRFPFTADLSATDSRANTDILTSNDLRTLRLKLRQQYRPQIGSSNYAASYEHNRLDSSTFGRDTVDVLTGDYGNNWQQHSVSATGTLSRNRRSGDSDRSRLFALSGRHTYRDEDGLATLESNASFTDNDLSFESAGVQNDLRTTVMSAGTSANWVPEEESPWTFNASASGFAFSSKSQGSSTDGQSLALGGSAAYLYSRNLRFNGIALATFTTSSGQSAVSTQQQLSTNYNADPIEFGNHSYTWNASAGVGNSTSSLGDGQVSAFTGLSHGVSRSIPFGSGGNVTYGLTQGVNSNVARGTSASHNVVHNGYVGWSGSAVGTGLSVSVNAADSRTFGNESSASQSFGLQVNGQRQLSRNSLVVANITVQGFRQDSRVSDQPLDPTLPSQAPSPTNVFANGTITYQNGRFFGVPNLYYTLTYSVATSNQNARLLGDPNANRDNTSQSLENRLDYRIGRVVMRAEARVTEIDGRKNALIFFRISRDFGAL